LPSQLILPLSPRSSMSREDFVVAGCNTQAVAFIDSWPDWPVTSVAIFGPAGSGKTHLASIWRDASGAHLFSASELGTISPPAGPIIVEGVDLIPSTSARELELFRLMVQATTASPILLTGNEAPSAWQTAMPDLASRFAALLSLPLWAPNEELLTALARKLLDDRQISVSEAVIARIVHSLERSPNAIRQFIARADARALGEGRPINLALVRDLMAEECDGLS
jgi:chromosomal replication initiation ATPase DnaA